MTNVKQPLVISLTIDLEQAQQGSNTDPNKAISITTNMSDLASESSNDDGNTEISSLNLSNRVTNALINKGIVYKEQLEQMSDDEITQIKGLGKTSFSELSTLLNRTIQKKIQQTSSKKTKSTPAPATESSVGDKTFADFDLSKRTLNVLDANGIENPAQLAAMSNAEIRKFKNAGRKTFDEFSQMIGRPLYQVTGKRGRPPVEKDNTTKSEKNSKRGRTSAKSKKAKNDVSTSITTEFAGKGFQMRTLNLLKDNGINSMEALNNLTEKDIRGWKGAGKIVVSEIMAAQDSATAPKASNDENSSANSKKSTTKATGEKRGRGRPKQTVSDLGLDNKTIKALEKNGIHFAKDLKSMSVSDLKDMKGLGKSKIEDVQQHVNLKVA